MKKQGAMGVAMGNLIQVKVPEKVAPELRAEGTSGVHSMWKGRMGISSGLDRWAKKASAIAGRSYYSLHPLLSDSNILYYRSSCKARLQGKDAFCYGGG